MADYTLFEIVQGETLFQEFRLTDDDRFPIDITDATCVVKASSPLSPSDFTFAATAETGSFTLRATRAATTGWPAGLHDVQLWLDWGVSADLRDERILEIRISVREALT